MKFKKGKKLISTVLAGAALFTMGLSGCGEKTASSGDTYTIDWYIVCGTAPSNVEHVEKAADEYLKDKLNVNIKLNYLSWAAYTERINVLNAGGEKYDIAWDSGDGYRLNSAKNAYLPLNDLMDKYAPKTKEIIGEDFLKGSQINGKNYGIPANKDKGMSPGFLYRTDLAEKYNLTEKLENVKKYEDLFPILDVIKEKEPSISPLFQDQNANTSILDRFDTVTFPVGIFIDGDGKLVNYIETEEYKEMCKQSSENLKNGYMKKDTKEKEENFFIELSGLKPGKDNELNGNRNYKWKQVSLGEPTMTNSDATGSLMCISRTSEQPELVMQFLELFNTDEYLHNLIVFGVENVDYTKNADGTISPIKESGYGNAGMQWIFGNTFLDYTVEGEDPQKAKLTEEFNNTVTASPAVGFVVDNEAIKTEVGACQNVRTEFKDRLANGTEDYESLLNEYISKLKAAGSDKIMEEVNKQYEEWKKNK